MQGPVGQGDRGPKGDKGDLGAPAVEIDIVSELCRADKPLYAHNGGVWLYFKENIPIKRRADLELLEETVVADIV